MYYNILNNIWTLLQHRDQLLLLFIHVSYIGIQLLVLSFDTILMTETISVNIEILHWHQRRKNPEKKPQISTHIFMLQVLLSWITETLKHQMWPSEPHFAIGISITYNLNATCLI